MKTLQSAHEAESPYAWTRLWIALALMTIGGSGMYSMAVALPPLQAEFASHGVMPRFPSRSR